MNTPKPCYECDNLYCDCMQEDNPCYDCECKLGLSLAHARDHGCNRFKHEFKLGDKVRNPFGKIGFITKINRDIVPGGAAKIYGNIADENTSQGMIPMSELEFVID